VKSFLVTVEILGADGARGVSTATVAVK